MFWPRSVVFFSTLIVSIYGLLLPLKCNPQTVRPTSSPTAGEKRATSDPATSTALAEMAIADGRKAVDRHDMATAQHNFEKAVRLAPKMGAAHAALGRVLLARGNVALAIHELEVARELQPSDTHTLIDLSTALSTARQYPQSIAVFRQIQPEPGVVTALSADEAIAVATAFSASGDPESAKPILEQCLAASEAAGLESAQLQDALGTVMAQGQDFARAKAHLQRAVAIDDGFAPAHFHLGMVEMTTGRPAEAAIELEKAHLLRPADIGYTLQLSGALLASNNEARAVELIRSALAAAPAGTDATPLKYRLAVALQAQGNAQDAMPLFAEVVASQPDDAEALTNFALAHVQLGDAKGAVPLYLRALKLTPSNPTLREDLGVAYLQQADLAHAIEQFHAGLLVDDSNPQLHYDLGLALKLKDDLAGAVPEFERAAELDQTLPDPPYTLGIIYMQQGQFEKAAASLERATTLRPGQADAWATLGSVYQQMQQPDKAVPALRQAIALAPEQPSPHITMAAILSAQGHKDEAAAERKTGASLTRAAVNRQKANFNLDSGNLLLKRGQTEEAIAQLQSAVDADPSYAAPHLALAAALDHAGRKAEAAEERRKAGALAPGATPGMK